MDGNREAGRPPDVSQRVDCCCVVAARARKVTGMTRGATCGSSLRALVIWLAAGPAVAQSCDPNYSGSCVPNVWPRDVDCAGGNGNGPYYTDGTQSFRVVGEDRYGLDTNDPDRLACEPPRS